MPLIPVRDLARRTREVLDDVERTRKIAIVTRKGRPVAALIPIDADDLEDFVLAGTQDYLTAMREADEDLAEGLTRPLDELIARPRRSTGSTPAGQRKPATARSSSRR